MTDDDPVPAAAPGHPAPDQALRAVLIAYTLMLVVSVVWGWVLLADQGRMTEDDVVAGTVVLEVLDAVITVVVLAAVGRSAPVTPARGRLAAWVVAAPALALLLVINFAYFEALRQFINPNAAPEPVELTLATVLMICVQPAVIEELFFRYVAFGVLTRVTGTATAVWVTSVMFAVAHLYNPLGVPYLFLAGLVFGIARVRGGLALPVVLHFLHNLTVTAAEGVR